MTLGETLQTLRKEASLSHEQVAQQLFVSRQTVSKWEDNQAEPGVENLKALARLYGVTLDRLVGMEPPPPPQPETARAEPEAPADGYLMFVLLFGLVCILISTGSMVAYGELQIPVALLAMLAGIWLRYPAVWGVIQVMLSWEVLMAVVHMMLGGTVVGGRYAAAQRRRLRRTRAGGSCPRRCGRAGGSGIPGPHLQ